MLVPKLIAAVKSLIPIDEVRPGGRGTHAGPGRQGASLLTLCLVCQAKACEALEALDELLESEAPVVTPHLSEVLAFCLEVSLAGHGPAACSLGVSLPGSDSC